MKKLLLIAVALFLIVAMLCACGQTATGSSTPGESSASEQESSSAEPDAESDVEVESEPGEAEAADLSGKLLGWQWASGTMDAIAGTFRETYPNVELEIVDVPQADYSTKVQTTIASGGEMADMFLTDISWRGTFYTLDIFENLEGAPYNLDRHDILEGVWSILENYDGNIVGLDLTVCPTVWAYKLSVAEKWLGTSDPDEIQAMVDTWDKFLETGKQVLADSNGEVKMLPTLYEVMTPVQNQKGESVINDAVIDMELVRSQFEQVIAMRDAGIIGEFEINSPAWATSYTTENYMFYATPSWGIVYYLHANDPDADGKYGAVLPAEGTYPQGGAAIHVFNGSENKAAAWEYAKMLCLSDIGSDALKASVGYISPYVGAWEREGFTSYPDAAFPNQDVGELLYEIGAKEMKNVVLNPYAAYLRDAFTGTVNNMRTDLNYTLDDALDYFRESIEAATSEVTFE